MGTKSPTSLILLLALVIAAGTTPAFAVFGYTTINPPPGGELSHLQILQNVYGQTFTASGVDYIGDGGISARRVYDHDDIVYNTTHVYNHLPTDVDQIWMDGTVTVTAIAKYASYTQAFGWNGGGLGTEFVELVDQGDIGGPGVSFQVTSGSQFLWGYQAKNNPNCGWWEPGLEWWSKPDKQNHCISEDHLVTYFIEGASSTEAVWLIFMEDLRFYDCPPSDRDYNDFVVEIRAIPEPASLLLLGFGALTLLRKRKS
ncbi:MAG: PEP-CTERM sorting domain-containing protein [Sedimentisphaerales bacterium]|nr:PEP-CTERM sorting domain-containing protein [Sedimentisphaerales bacterium]